MKTIFTFLLLGFTSLLLSAQPKQPPKPVVPIQARPAAPKGPLPYVLKKDYDDNVASITSKINSVAGSTYGIRNMINAKDAQISELGQKINKIEETLNSTTFKVANTSDSLSQTRITFSQYMNENETRLNNMNAASAQTALWVWIVLGVAIILPLLLFVVLFLQQNKFKTLLTNQSRAMEAKLEEGLSRNRDFMQSEIKNQQFYTDRTTLVVKNELSKSMKSEMELIGREMSNINNEIQALNNKIGPQENSES